MARLQAVLVVALSLPLALAAVASEKDVFQHFRRVQKFKCSLPRLTAVPVSSLTTDFTTKHYSPSMTVLHRCDPGAGCCLNPGYTCGPVRTETVYLVFHVSYVIDVKKHLKGSKVETIAATNHTRCECVEVTQAPR